MYLSLAPLGTDMGLSYPLIILSWLLYPDGPSVHGGSIEIRKPMLSGSNCLYGSIMDLCDPQRTGLGPS